MLSLFIQDVIDCKIIIQNYIVNQNTSTLLIQIIIFILYLLKGLYPLILPILHYLYYQTAEESYIQPSEYILLYFNNYHENWLQQHCRISEPWTVYSNWAAAAAAAATQSSHVTVASF